MIVMMSLYYCTAGTSSRYVLIDESASSTTAVVVILRRYGFTVCTFTLYCTSTQQARAGHGPVGLIQVFTIYPTYLSTMLYEQGFFFMWVAVVAVLSSQQPAAAQARTAEL